jgi:hypothetical protein
MTTLTLRDLGFLGAITREPDPYFSNVTFLLRNGTGNGSGIPTNEDSASAKALTFSGGATTSTSALKYGNSSFSFNGSGGITTPHSTDFNLGSQDFTIEAWVRPTALAIGGEYALVHKYGSNGYSFLLYVYRGLGLGNPYFLFFDWTTNNATRKLSAVNINSYFSISTFQHYAVTRQGSTLRLFANGNLLTPISGSVSIGADSIYSGTQVLSIGASSPGAPIGNTIPAFSGHQDDIRITTGICRYTDSFTPPAAELSNF